MTLRPRPTAAELVEAVGEFLERDVVGREELPGRVSFHARVAVNVLGMVERELTLGPELEAAERTRLCELLGHDGEADALTAELARAVRDGSLDERRDEVTAVVRESVRAKLLVANPRYVEA
ncbi:MAG: hypothetical protein H0V95_09115 [Actinobacteria bacterium]|nr:hypothetical protein [Actinomycetota bacterium]